MSCSRTVRFYLCFQISLPLHNGRLTTQCVVKGGRWTFCTKTVSHSPFDMEMFHVLTMRKEKIGGLLMICQDSRLLQGVGNSTFVLSFRVSVTTRLYSPWKTIMTSGQDVSESRMAPIPGTARQEMQLSRSLDGHLSRMRIIEMWFPKV